MLSVEFISTSSTDEDFENYPSSSSSTTSANNNNNQSISNADPPAPLKYSTNPDGLKFVPQAPIQFYYSLQKNSLRTVIDTLLSNSELGSLCTVFRVPCYGKWLKKRVAADMLVDHILMLKQAYKIQEFNEIVDKINALKGKEMLGRIPKLPIKINPIPLLKKSISLSMRFNRPKFPVRLGSPLKEVTGLIFLDEVILQASQSVVPSSASFTVDLYFSLPVLSGPEHYRYILCLYKASERVKSTSDADKISSASISPTLLDFTLNGSILEQGACRFRNHDCFDITLLCYKDRSNLLRILRHETHLDLKHLVFEIIAINIAGSLSESLSSAGAIKRARMVQDPEDLRFATVSEKILKETELEVVPFEAVLSHLRGKSDDGEVELLEEVCVFDLKCPLSRTRMSRAVKFKSCRHGQCFDMFNFQQITQNLSNLRAASHASSSVNKKKANLPTLSCPVCNHVVTEEDELIIDGFFKKALEVCEDDDVSVELNLADGTFKFIKEANDDSAFESDEDGNEIVGPPIICVSKDDELIINLTDDDDEIERNAALLSYPIDKSKPIGSCPSRAITID